MTSPELLRVTVPTWALVMALPKVSVPALALSVPVLLKVAGLIVKVCPAVLAMMVPALLMVATELWVKPPRP